MKNFTLMVHLNLAADYSQQFSLRKKLFRNIKTSNLACFNPSNSNRI